MATSVDRKQASRIGMLVAAAALVVAGAACVPAPAADPAPTSSAPGDSFTQRIFDLVNSARTSRGLRPLAWSSQLGDLAADWSDQMASRGSLSHRDLGAVLYSAGWESWTSLGENILTGPSGMSADDVHNAWMGSAHHYANIVGNWDSIGIGYTIRNGDLWITEDFGLHF